MKIKIISAAIIALASSSVFSGGHCVQNKNQLTGLVGLDSSSGVVYASTQSTQNECGCPQVRFTPESTNTNMALSILMAAKLSGKTVRIDLTDSANCDSAYRVYIE